MHLYDKVPISDCKRATGEMQIIVRDINKGDCENPSYMSRIVAREIHTYKRDDLFAAIPPLEAFRAIISMTATANKGEVIMVNDISRAFFHANVERDVYVQLPQEDQKVGEEHLSGKLRLSMYGTRDAAQDWYKEYSQQLMNVGFIQGKASPCAFLPPKQKNPNSRPRRRLRQHRDARRHKMDERGAGKKIFGENINSGPRQRPATGNKNIEQNSVMEWC